MARPEGITFRGANYLPDWGDPAAPFRYSYTFKVPDGLSDDDIDTIITTVGGSVVNEIGKGIPCDDVEGFPWTPRKLKFWFASGKTVSVPIPNKNNLVTASAEIATTLGLIAEVVCVSLEGETWRNILDHLPVLGPVPLPTPIAIANTPPGQKEPSYVGSMSYESDGTREFNKAFKMATNLPDNQPYAEYAAAIDNCLVAGGAINTSSARCSGFRSKTFDHRRFNVTMLQNRRVISGAGGETESEVENAKSKMLVPMSSRDPVDIRACAIALRDVPATLCLGYRGEWDKRFSVKNPGALP